MRVLVLMLAVTLLGACLGLRDVPATDREAEEVAEAAADGVTTEAPGGEAEADAAPDAADAGEDATPDPVAEEPEPERKSPQQIECERRGGRFAPLSPGSTLRTCLKTTRDFTRQCSSGADCEGSCLARSRTCAPVVPLLGCNEVVLEGGSTAMECIQ